MEAKRHGWQVGVKFRKAVLSSESASTTAWFGNGSNIQRQASSPGCLPESPQIRAETDSNLPEFRHHL